MLNDNRAYFATSWDIDQVLIPEPISIFLNIGAAPFPDVTPATASSTYVHGLGYLPVLEGQYQGQGLSTWHQCGLPDGFIMANWDISDHSLNPYYPGMLQTNGITVSYGFDTQNVYFTALNYNSVAQTISIRLYIWADKVNY